MQPKFIDHPVKVFLWGVEIGQLFWDESIDNTCFFFSPEYFKSGIDISPILYPIGSSESRNCIYGIKDDRVYQKLPPFIADSLPDSWGNAIFDEWFSKNGYKSKDKTPLMKLSFLGKMAMGALEFIPSLRREYLNGKVNVAELYKEAKLFEERLQGMSVRNDKTITGEALRALGSSPGGSRSKAVISETADGVFVSGKMATDSSCKHYIIKFNDPKYSFSETEMTYQQLALLSGIDMMPSRLLEIQGIKHFLTERYDRREGRKIFVQTLAAINRCDETYENLFQTCRMLNFSEPQMEEMFRRTAFNFLMNNTDDHRKNFSFMINDKGQWSLAPHYDVTFILDTTGNKPCETHVMSLNGKYSEVMVEDLLVFADKNNIRNAKAIIDKIAESSLQFRSLAEKNGIRSDIIEIIDNRLNALRPKEFHLQKISSPPLFTENGLPLCNVFFERTEKGNIHLWLTINGQHKKHVFTSKQSDYQMIIQDGFNNMPSDKKIALVKKYFTEYIARGEETVQILRGFAIPEDNIKELLETGKTHVIGQINVREKQVYDTDVLQRNVDVILEYHGLAVNAIDPVMGKNLGALDQFAASEGTKIDLSEEKKQLERELTKGLEQGNGKGIK